MNNFMEMMCRVFMRDDNIAPVFRYLFAICGGALFFADIKLWNTGWIWYVGFAVALVGGYSARAAQLKIRPFSSAPYPRGWLKSRWKKRSADED
ncbi:hypothetical protein ACFWXM_18780 [Achromobacter xylosoxidans]|uniref:hypothetical protein n=1 Tax=Alcaligenes xylosoxydans xylosoxydans TaxID=85698 RepID=UPI0022B8CC69|nr:hypothetical protein [Achromobacter xylosoxidans]MCZ8383277.1 hypothetical protein [Achromobacter xylosoxidans]